MTRVGFGGVLLWLRGGSGSERIRRQRLTVARAALELLLLSSKSPSPAQSAVLLAQGAVFQAGLVDAEVMGQQKAKRRKPDSMDHEMP